MSTPAPPSAKSEPAQAAPKRRAAKRAPAAPPLAVASASTGAGSAGAGSTAPGSAGAAKEAAKVEVPPDMLPVPAGKFTMGNDGVGERDEQPAHEVTLKAFLLDKTEVTNAAYLECVAAKACRPYRDDVAKSMKYGAEAAFRGAKQPVVGVSWNDAKAYCEWRGKRLPTEAEFERASRGDDGRTYVWGNAAPDPAKHAVFSAGATGEVGSRPEGAGPFGHLDLSGNVWEWIEDHYDPYAYKRSTAAQGVPGSCEQILKTQDELRETGQQGYTGTNPIPNECERVLRGGAFNYHAKGLRASNRVHHPGTWRLLVAGFRCAKDG